MPVQSDDMARAPGVALDDQSREKARRALLAMLAEAPVHRIAMREAARRAGVGLATLYKYFGGKEAMVTAVLNPELDALIHQLSEASRREVGVKVRFKAVLTASLVFARDHEDAARAVILNLPAGVWTDDADAWPARRRAVLVQILKNGRHDGSVRTDLDPQDIADMTLGAVDRAVEKALRTADAIEPSKLAERLFALLWPAVNAD
jgi:AcrR family transcriptional regulator